MRQGMRMPLVLAALIVLLGPTFGADARGRVNIRDDAGLLSASDKQSIQQAAQAAPFDTTVWIAKGGYSGNKRAFVGMTDRLVGSGQVVIALDPVDKWDDVAARQNTGLTTDETKQAAQIATSNFHSGDWSGGITAIIQSLVQVAPAGGARTTNRSTNQRPVSRGGRLYAAQSGLFSNGRRI